MSELAAPPVLEFDVTGAEPIEHAATPGVRFHVQAADPEGNEIYTVALTTQIQIDPALRVHTDSERARLVELFGSPERWATTTRALQWARVESLVPSFTGSTAFALEMPCTYDLEVVSAKYIDALDDGEVPLTFHFNGTVLYCGADDRLQVVLVPWSCSVRWRMPVAVWRRHDRRPLPRRRLDPAGSTRRSRRSRGARRELGAHTFDDTVRELL